jgi:hypothetical protein
MRKYIYVFLLQLFSIFALAQYELTPISISGNAENTYTLVIVAEGYTTSQMNDFKADAENMTNVLFLNPTYGALKNKMNVYALSTPSNESGISLIANGPSPTDPIQVTNKKDTFFGIYFQNSYRAHFLDPPSSIKARKIASQYVPFSDNVLILVNDDSERSSGRADINLGVCTATKIPSNEPDYSYRLYIPRHELGHSIAGLGDSYSDYREETFNKTTNNDANTIRWKNFLSNPQVGIFSIYESNVYRPNNDCIMNIVSNYFCPVCEHRVREVILGKNKRLRTPYRLFTKERVGNSFLLSWDSVPGASKYEIVFMDNSSSGVLKQKVVSAPDTTALLENLVLNEGFGTFIVSIRAFNDEYSTFFSSDNRVPNISFYPQNPPALPVPSNISINKLNVTSVRLNWQKGQSIADKYLIRLYSEEGVLTELVTDDLSIELKNLIPNKKYKFAIAAANIYSHDQAEYIASDFSRLIEFTTNFTPDLKPTIQIANLNFTEGNDDYRDFVVNINEVANIGNLPNQEIQFFINKLSAFDIIYSSSNISEVGESLPLTNSNTEWNITEMPDKFLLSAKPTLMIPAGGKKIIGFKVKKNKNVANSNQNITATIIYGSAGEEFFLNNNAVINLCGTVCF